MEIPVRSRLRLFVVLLAVPLCGCNSKSSSIPSLLLLTGANSLYQQRFHWQFEPSRQGVS
jgi:hypothetical protein